MRFWPQFEYYLATSSLGSSEEGDTGGGFKRNWDRLTIKCIQSCAGLEDETAAHLKQKWNISVDAARKKLEKPDVKVTNKKDKEKQNFKS